MFKKSLGTIFALGLAMPASASLTSLSWSNAIEEQAAIANQAVYDDLHNEVSGCKDEQLSADADCGGLTFKVWQNVRELVHAANEITGLGSTFASLGGNQETLGFALRWTAAEEFGSHGNLTERFANAATASIAARVAALRSGAQGFNFAYTEIPGSNDFDLDYPHEAIYGAASGDDASQAWSQWGGFLNTSYTLGEKGGTDREVAYDFDGYTLNGGFDYRIDNNWVVGAIFSYADQEVEFEPGPNVIVKGEVLIDSFSISPFAMYQSATWFASFSLGFQSSDFETHRYIQYSRDPLGVSPSIVVDTVAESDNSSDSLTFSASAGYAWQPLPDVPFIVEPSLGINYQDVTIDEYSETDINDEAFNFVVLEQEFESLESVVGVKLAHTFSVEWLGILSPFFQGSWYREHKDDERTIDTYYGEIAEPANPDGFFRMLVDAPEHNYQVYTIGFTTVLKGSSQTSIDGPASGGIQAFFTEQFIKGIDDYSQRIWTVGMRYEF